MKIKPALFSFSILITILSCNQTKNGYEIDCNYEKRQAQNDFHYKNYTWTLFSGLGYDYLGEKEFIQLLHQKNIKANKISLSCIRYLNGKYENCRETEMNRLIENKFGKNFIDSLKYIAKQQFVKNHPEEVFSYEECDMTTRIPNSSYDNQFDKIQKNYFFQYPLPKNYINKTNQEFYSSTSANFILTKNGEIKDLSIESSFENKKNNIFEKQFNQQLKNFVLHTKWIPAKINGINVDSYMEANISYN
ncbi:hypothetical protein [Chryseobacterium limigenitum]|uniref:Uncharacterized protein n=1 Tax=Chryseobacterium limigenitum TaxID=1612149 RepID=A0A1K2ITW5_9FLAO|nr:hypothetical protein [Chryseobacterium limigenitum]SFZ95624.1 hypothetical protein SAMN05216324_11179 [Chryseobacterium limigenitum]